MPVEMSSPIFIWMGAIVIALITAVHMIGLRVARKRALAFGNFPALEESAGDKLFTRNFLMLFLRIMIIISLSISLSDTVIKEDVESAFNDIGLAIDVSQTMSATDYHPNRLEAAKKGAAEFVSALSPETRVGLVAFADRAAVVSPLEKNKRLLQSSLESVKISEIPGTAIGSAILSLADILPPGGVAILLTDGNSNAGVSVDEALKVAGDKNLTIYTIGIGKSEGIGIDLDEKELQSIAARTGGAYFPALNESSISEIYKGIVRGAGGEKVERTSVTGTFLLLAFFLLLVEWVLMNVKYRTLP